MVGVQRTLMKYRRVRGQDLGRRAGQRRRGESARSRCLLVRLLPREFIDYRGTPLIRNRHLVGPCSRTMPRLLWRSQGGGAVSYERGTPVQNQHDHVLRPPGREGVYRGNPPRTINELRVGSGNYHTKGSYLRILTYTWCCMKVGPDHQGVNKNSLERMCISLRTLSSLLLLLLYYSRA